MDIKNQVCSLAQAKRLKELYDQDYPRLKRLAYSVAGNEWEDILQESFIKMIPFQHLSYSEAQALVTTIVKNRCLDWMRRRKYVTRQLAAMPEPDHVTQPKYTVEINELRTEVRRLPVYTCVVIELRFFEGMKLREIGKIVGKDHATVSYQIQTGLKKLKLVI